MEFESFEHALKVCMTAPEGGEEQETALLYCLEHAPADLREIIKDRYRAHKAEGCGCGCNK